MAAQACEDMMTVLPDRFSDDQWRVRVNAGKNIHPLALAGNKAMLLDRIVWMTSFDGHTFTGEGFDDSAFGFGLRRPARLIRGKTQVAAGDEDSLACADTLWLFDFR